MKGKLVLFITMNIASSKVECLSALYLSVIKQPVKKLLLYTATDPSFQSLAKSFRVLKNVTRNIDDLADCFWTRFQQRRKPEGSNEQKYPENQKKSSTDHYSSYDGSKRSSLKTGAPHNKNKRYLAVMLLSVLDASNYPVTSDITPRRRNSDSSICTSTISSMKFKYGLSLLGKREGTFPNVLKSDNPFPLMRTLLVQHPIKKTHLEENLHVLNYRMSRAIKVLERRFGIHAAKLMKPFPFTETTVNRVTKSARILNRRPSFCQLVNYEISHSVVSYPKKRSLSVSAV